MNHPSKKIVVLLIIGIFSFSTAACGQRMPKPGTAQNALKGYFNNYGDDFEETDFGQFELDEIEVSKISELQHGMVYVEAYVSLDEGNIVYRVGVTLLKKTLRWKVISWENLGKAT